MIVRLEQAPDPNDAELPRRAADPILTAVRADLTTRAAEGRRVTFRANGKYDHRLDQVTIDGASASLVGCKIDDSIQVDANGSVVDDSIQTATIEATFNLVADNWVAVDVRFTNTSEGVSGCAS
jgi:hypothetical protein